MALQVHTTFVHRPVDRIRREFFDVCVRRKHQAAFVAVAFVDRFHRQQTHLSAKGVPCAVSTVWQNWLLLKWPGSALLCSLHTSSTMRGALVFGQHA